MAGPQGCSSLQMCWSVHVNLCLGKTILSKIKLLWNSTNQDLFVITKPLYSLLPIQCFMRQLITNFHLIQKICYLTKFILSLFDLIAIVFNKIFKCQRSVRSLGLSNMSGSPGLSNTSKSSDPLTRLGYQVDSVCLCLWAHLAHLGPQSCLDRRARLTCLCRRASPVHLGRWASPTHLGHRTYLGGVGCRAWPTCLSCQGRPTHMCHQVTSSIWVVVPARPVWVVGPARPVCVVRSVWSVWIVWSTQPIMIVEFARSVWGWVQSVGLSPECEVEWKEFQIPHFF